MLLISYGTRPEWIKIKPILNHLKMPYKKLFTGQHLDIAPRDADCIQLNIKDGPNRLDSIIQSILNNEEIYKGITHVMVQGDTTSAFAVALGAFHRNIKIIHLEAGLRTYNKTAPYPEEFNRHAISLMADIHLCPTQSNANNLRKEKIKEGIHIVGNTVLDNLIDVRTSYGQYILITLHRRENHLLMKEWFEALNKVANALPNLTLLFPLHPNPNVQKYKDVLEDNIIISPPLHYQDFQTLLANCKFIISDSGGVQEEASFLKKRVIVCRTTTERPEGLGNHMLCNNPADLVSLSKIINHNYKANDGCPFGDGQSGKRIAEILKDECN